MHEGRISYRGNTSLVLVYSTLYGSLLDYKRVDVAELLN
jgi:hypothetical protein